MSFRQHAPLGVVGQAQPGLKGSIGEGPNHSNHSNHSNSFKIGMFPRKFKNFRKFQHFLNYRRNSDKISSKSEQKSVNRIQNFANFCQKNAKKIDDKFLKCWGLSGAKACKSCRSRQELSNEYLLAKFGVDTEENEPCKVCSFGWKIRERFDIEPFN